MVPHATLNLIVYSHTKEQKTSTSHLKQMWIPQPVGPPFHLGRSIGLGKPYSITLGRSLVYSLFSSLNFYDHLDYLDRVPSPSFSHAMI